MAVYASQLQVTGVLVFGWLALITGISSLAANNWVNVGIVSVGLFKMCAHTVCLNISDPPAWLMATRAFLVISVFAIFAGNIAMTVFKFKYQQKQVQQTAIALLLFGGILAIMSISIYAGKSSSLDEKYSTGFVLAWITSVFALLASGIGCASLRLA
ncbi:lens fiber membrane intrinsic protein-like [Clavelina lepadiformis]|uniref:lens fiber membrane intrinsic protein-like n=1 Tax=Clavelina lepadiformis TaxID=159417 RepID=UPI0040432F37